MLVTDFNIVILNDTVYHCAIIMLSTYTFLQQHNLGDIQRYTQIALYPTASLCNIIIIFDTVLTQKRNVEHEI